jgi:hypothetical protein
MNEKSVLPPGQSHPSDKGRSDWETAPFECLLQSRIPSSSFLRSHLTFSGRMGAYLSRSGHLAKRNIFIYMESECQDTRCFEKCCLIILPFQEKRWNSLSLIHKIRSVIDPRWVYSTELKLITRTSARKACSVVYRTLQHKVAKSITWFLHFSAHFSATETNGLPLHPSP